MDFVGRPHKDKKQGSSLKMTPAILNYSMTIWHDTIADVVLRAVVVSVCMHVVLPSALKE